MESNGDWIAYLDSDNTWHCDHLMYLLFATINQENNKLNGDYAKVDIAKGISTMLSKNSGFISGEFVNLN